MDYLTITSQLGFRSTEIMVKLTIISGSDSRIYRRGNVLFEQFPSFRKHPAKTRQARPGELQTERGERTVGLASCLGDYGLTQGDLCWRVFVCSASLDLPPTWKFPA